MESNFDYIVLGCGGLGSAALYWLARQAKGSILGLEQHKLGHDYGSSQDHSRIIRLSYDDPAYAALAPYAFIAWRDVEAESGIQLVYQTGGLILGPGPQAGEETEVQRYASAMQRSGIPFESLSAAETMRRFPQFHLKADDEVLFQSFSGLVDARKANAVHITLARARGAQVLDQTTVQDIEPLTDGVRLTTSRGVFNCRRLVLASGAWTNFLLQHIGRQLPLTVTEEQVTYFATPYLREFAPDRFPVWIWHGESVFYGFPVYGEVAVKAGEDLGGDAVTVENRKMQPNPRPYNNLVSFLAEHIPDSLGPVLYTKPCLYTMPPDRGFILDSLPGAPQICMAIGAGHAFKFASLIGKILSDLAVHGQTPYPIQAMRLDRPAITDPDFTSLIHPKG